MSLLNSQLKRLQGKQGIKFKTGFMNLGAKKVITAAVLALLRDEQSLWKLDNKLYFTHQFETILQFMTDNNVQILFLNDNCHASILKELLNTHFHDLRELNLSKNNIASIQLIPQLHMPKLAIIDLSQNQITMVRSLNRLIAPLITLKLQDNPILDIQLLARSSFKSLQQLDLEVKSKHNLIGGSLAWILKMPSRVIEQLRCASKKRIKEEWLYPYLAKKYPKGRISLH